ncbi:hypothetical protein Leryth_005354 [Lithospermum erythrorhizon]|nr:hypothetical protein Leryth_005354 [Lithospermum erythrorhizon]
MSHEDYIISPSKYAFRAYDAIWILGKAMQSSKGSIISSRELIHQMLSSEPEGLSGRLRFKNGFLSQKIVFSIVNVIRQSYRELTQWEQKGRFFEDSREGMNKVFWPGGQQEVPLGYNSEKQLMIAVPLGACEQIVKVSFHQNMNETSFPGISIEVFEAAVKKLPYQLNYKLFPFGDSYDNLMKAVQNEVHS